MMISTKKESDDIIVFTENYDVKKLITIPSYNSVYDIEKMGKFEVWTYAFTRMEDCCDIKGLEKVIKITPA
jgi:hypothetical protein